MLVNVPSPSKEISGKIHTDPGMQTVGEGSWASDRWERAGRLLFPLRPLSFIPQACIPVKEEWILTSRLNNENNESNKNRDTPDAREALWSTVVVLGSLYALSHFLHLPQQS